MSGELLLINPRKRKTARKSATRKTKTKRHAKRRSSSVVVMANPAPRRRRSRLSALRTKVKRASRKYRRNPAPKLSINSITAMAKDAAIGAAGALAVDVAFGYAKTALPASMQEPTATDGSINPMYFAAKGGLAVLVGVLGAKLTKHAGHMAAGSLTVSAYEVMRTFVPLTVALGGYRGPRVAAPRRQASRVNGMGQYVSGARSGYTPPSARPYLGEFVS
ncbi:MAG TPA: hypothetical protein VJ577_11405 [Burkholderiaceae bacterium]|nr:hypothetical protein [Burkholderiaceae bacterium]